MTEKRLLPVSGKQMVNVFGKIGYKVERQKGSHIVMSKPLDMRLEGIETELPHL